MREQKHQRNTFSEENSHFPTPNNGSMKKSVHCAKNEGTFHFFFPFWKWNALFFRETFARTFSQFDVGVWQFVFLPRKKHFRSKNPLRNVLLGSSFENGPRAKFFSFLIMVLLVKRTTVTLHRRFLHAQNSPPPPKKRSENCQDLERFFSIALKNRNPQNVLLKTTA